MMTTRPPKLAYCTVYSLVTLYCWVVVVIIMMAFSNTDEHISASDNQIGLLVGAILALPIATAFMRFQWIDMQDDRIVFNYTRYLLPKREEALYAQIRHIILYDGLFASDGRPRPYIRVERRDATTFWVPLPLYSWGDIKEIVETLKSKSIPLEVQGRFRVAIRQ